MANNIFGRWESIRQEDKKFKIEYFDHNLLEGVEFFKDKGPIYTPADKTYEFETLEEAQKHLREVSDDEDKK